MAKKETKKAAKNAEKAAKKAEEEKAKLEAEEVARKADCSCSTLPVGYQCPTCVEYYASLEKK